MDPAAVDRGHTGADPDRDAVAVCAGLRALGPGVRPLPPLAAGRHLAADVTESHAWARHHRSDHGDPLNADSPSAEPALPCCSSELRTVSVRRHPCVRYGRDRPMADGNERM
jgi:hypothetical protein